MELITACELAGGRNDGLERTWLLEVQTKDKKVEHFAKSCPLIAGQEGTPPDPDLEGRFERLDRALAIGMRPMLKKWCGKEAYTMRKHDEKATFEGGSK